MRHYLFSNFLKQMVSGSKLKNPSKVSGDSPISLYYSLIYGNCLGNVVMGIEKCGKMCENVEKCVKMCWRPVFYILLSTAANELINSDVKETLLFTIV